MFIRQFRFDCLLVAKHWLLWGAPLVLAALMLVPFAQKKDTTDVPAAQWLSMALANDLPADMQKHALVEALEEPGSAANAKRLRRQIALYRVAEKRAKAVDRVGFTQTVADLLTAPPHAGQQTAKLRAYFRFLAAHRVAYYGSVDTRTPLTMYWLHRLLFLGDSTLVLLVLALLVAALMTREAAGPADLAALVPLSARQRLVSRGLAVWLGGLFVLVATFVLVSVPVAVVAGPGSLWATLPIQTAYAHLYNFPALLGYTALMLALWLALMIGVAGCLHRVHANFFGCFMLLGALVLVPNAKVVSLMPAMSSVLKHLPGFYANLGLQLQSSEILVGNPIAYLSQGLVTVGVAALLALMASHWLARTS